MIKVNICNLPPPPLRLRFVAAVLACLALSANAESYPSFRLMTFNICHCATHWSYSITDEDVQRTASVIAAENPDFVCLQEVDKETTRSDGIDETARFAELLTSSTGMQWYGTFGKGRDYQGGEFGVAVLSKSEPLSVSTTAIEGSEPRSLLVCEFKDFCVATVHLDNNRDYRTNSIPIIRDALAPISKPVFITGDWNATPTSDATLAKMKEFLTVISPESGVRTFGDIDGDDYVIDYIAVDSAHADKFYVKRGWCMTNKVGDQGSSDHNPVIVELVQRPAAEDFAWIEENAVTTEMTGKWATPVAYDAETLRAELMRENAFTPSTHSDGNEVTIEMAVAFHGTGLGDESLAPLENVQAAIRLGESGFLLWTADGWTPVAAEGVTPEVDVEYTFRFTFDYAAKTYSVDVNGSALQLQLETPTTTFPLATSGTAISEVAFKGDGSLTSIMGEYVVAEGFGEGEKVALAGATATLTAARAAWLNTFGDKTAVGGSLAGLTSEKFDAAYLLNFDFTDGEFSYRFDITDIAVHEDRVEIAVSLTREGSTKGAINGKLNFYGAATLADFKSPGLKPLATKELDGKTTSVEISLEGENPPAFFNAKIEEK